MTRTSHVHNSLTQYIMGIKRHQCSLLGAFVVFAFVTIVGGTYRWFKDPWTDGFREMTLKKVNAILVKLEKITPWSECDYRETPEWFSLECWDGWVIWWVLTWMNKGYYKCTPLKVDSDSLLDTSSWVCYRWKPDNQWTVRYYDSKWNTVDLDYVPDRWNPLPLTAHRW